jgi:preprotein translocase subunit SecD
VTPRRVVLVVTGLVLVGLLIALIVVAVQGGEADPQADGTARLELRPVISAEEVGDEGCPPPERSQEGALLCSSDESAVARLGPVIVDDADVDVATAEESVSGEWVVNVTLTDAGRAVFFDATRSAAGARPPSDRIAIVVDGVIVSVPQVNEPILGGQFEVSGLTQEQAEDLAAEFS